MKKFLILKHFSSFMFSLNWWRILTSRWSLKILWVPRLFFWQQLSRLWGLHSTEEAFPLPILQPRVQIATLLNFFLTWSSKQSALGANSDANCLNSDANCLNSDAPKNQKKSRPQTLSYNFADVSFHGGYTSLRRPS